MAGKIREKEEEIRKKKKEKEKRNKREEWGKWKGKRENMILMKDIYFP